MNQTLRREIEVAFSKHSQPMWFRVIKWIILITGIYCLWDREDFWTSILFFIISGIAVHFYWRYKTKSWTQSWFGWDYEKNKRH